MIRIRIVLIVLFCLTLAGCGTQAPPSNPSNICKIFQQYPDWYTATKQVEKKWKVPIPVQMAIVYQESSFNAKARPPRRKLLWVIPWTRSSSAYGYSQALKHTWQDYEQQTGSSGNRAEFSDAVDFIGWYSNQVHRTLNINPANAYQLYLAYHEGPLGYTRRTYLRKPWLVGVSKKVVSRTRVYQSQLTRCGNIS